MKRKINILVLLLATVMLSATTKAENMGYSPVYFCYRHTPILSGNHKPTKAPAHYELTLSAIYDEQNQNLILSDAQGKSYVYYIYNENECIVLQGALNFVNSGELAIDLNSLSCGQYTMEILVGEYSFWGTIEIE